MIRLNLLRRTPSLRDTVRPDTPSPAAPPPIWRRPAVRYAALAAVIIVAGLWYLGAEVSLNLGETSYTLMKPETVKQSAMPPAPQVRERGEVEAGKEEPPALAMDAQPPVKTEEAKKAGNARGKEDKAPDAIPTASAVPAEAPPMLEQKKDAARGDWSLRLALCVYRKSCEDMAGSLKKRGIGSHIEEGEAAIPVNYVIIGPLSGPEKAGAAQAGLRAKGLGTARLAADGGVYLSAGPYVIKKEAEEAAAKARATGHGVKMSMKRENMKAYKLYHGAFADEAAARLALAKYRAEGIECVVEKRN